MITDDQALHWIWDRYIESRFMTDIEYWFDRYTENKTQQIEGRDQYVL